MALTKCKECGHKVGISAKSCPLCGRQTSMSTGVWFLVIFLVLIFSLFGIFYYYGSDMSSKTPTVSKKEAPDTVELKASVSFDGSKFTITNDDSFAWVNVEMEINGGVIRGGYVLEHPQMVAGQTYTVGSMQFAKGDGTRFNPFTMKPQKFVIYSRDSSGMPKGIWYGGWK